MKITKWWRIVPHLLLVFAGSSGLTLAALPSAPASPTSVEQARTIVEAVPALTAQIQQRVEEEQQSCYKKTFVSGCLRDLEEQKARLLRDVAVSEKAAREILRQEDIRLRDMTKPRPAPSTNSEISPVLQTEDNATDSSVTGTIHGADKAPASTRQAPVSKPANVRPSKPDQPALTAAEQERNRQAFDVRQQEARQRQTDNAKRTAELAERRAAYQKRLEERRQQAAKRVGEKKGASSDAPLTHASPAVPTGASVVDDTK